MDDRKAIREIQNGNKEYLNLLAEKYYDDIYRFCCYQTGDPDTAYDLAQETFLRFIRYVDHYRYKNLKGYLLTIARNVCFDFFSKETAAHRHLSYSPLDEAPEEEPAVEFAHAERSAGECYPGGEFQAACPGSYEAAQDPERGHCASQPLRSEAQRDCQDHRHQFIHSEIPDETGHGQAEAYIEKGEFLCMTTRYGYPLRL